MRKAWVLVALLCGLSLLILAVTVAMARDVAATGLQALPATSTGTGHTPLVVLGVGIFAAGVVLLRRPAVVPNP
jgi:LPXTG-motif cell wall-anchored protein